MTQELLTSSQAAEYLGYTRQRVDQLGASGELPRVRMGHFWVYPKSDLDQFLSAAVPSSRRPKTVTETAQINEEPRLAVRV